MLITALGSDLMGNIFKFLSMQDQLRCQKVCKTWNGYFLQPSCRATMEIEKKWTSSQFCEFLASQILPSKEKMGKMLKTRIRNAQVTTLYKSCSLALLNYVVLKELFTYSHKAITEWKLLPIQERFQKMYLENEQIRLGTYDYECDYETLYRPSEYQHLQKFDAIKLHTIHLLYKHIPLIISVYVQAWNIYKHVNELNDTWNRAPEATNQHVIATLTYPDRLKQDNILRWYVCQRSGRIPVLPVEDIHGHALDYLQIRNHITGELRCPINNQQLFLKDLKFDKKTFVAIQKRIKELKLPNSFLLTFMFNLFKYTPLFNLLNLKWISTFNLSPSESK